MKTEKTKHQHHSEVRRKAMKKAYLEQKRQELLKRKKEYDEKHPPTAALDPSQQRPPPVHQKETKEKETKEKEQQKENENKEPFQKSLDAVQRYIESGQSMLGATITASTLTEQKQIKDKWNQDQIHSKKKQLEEAKLYVSHREWRCRRREQIVQLTVLAWCTFVVILALAGMSLISYRTQGKWYVEPPMSHHSLKL
jgi:hypothetical protein